MPHSSLGYGYGYGTPSLDNLDFGKRRCSGYKGWYWRDLCLPVSLGFTLSWLLEVFLMYAVQLSEVLGGVGVNVPKCLGRVVVF